jgi:hypothetical protein
MRLKQILLIAIVLTSVFILATLGIIGSVFQTNSSYPNAISIEICDPTATYLSGIKYRAVQYRLLSYSCSISPDSPDQVMDWYQRKGWERTPALGRPYQTIVYSNQFLKFFLGRVVIARSEGNGMTSILISTELNIWFGLP